MSELVLLVVLGATFGAVALGGVAVQGALADRHRAARILESHIRRPASLREQELARPFGERALLPLFAALRAFGRRITPVDTRRRLARSLVLAGSPAGWDAERVAAMKVAGVVGGGVLGLADASLLGLGAVQAAALAVVLAGVGYVAPDGVLASRARRRQDAVRRSLADTIDLLTISVEAGLGFDAALAHVARTVPGPLSQEIARTLQEVQLGQPRLDAFRALAARLDVDDLNSFVLAMVQADVFGISVSSVLRTQARELRVKRRQRAERKAMQVPVKILFPLVFCVMPSLFVVLGGPAAIRVLGGLFGS